jgi:hypothetical protein
MKDYLVSVYFAGDREIKIKAKNKREAIKKAKAKITKINPLTLIHRDYPGNKPDIDAEQY